MLPIYIATADYCDLIEMPVKRFEGRRYAERMTLAVAESLGRDDDLGLLPISPREEGKYSRFGFSDALALRLVLEMEIVGHDFTVAAKFMRTAGLSGFWSHDDANDGDYFVGFFAGPDGLWRRCFGTSRELARAVPPSPHVQFALNVTSTARALRRRAADKLGLAVRGSNFYALEALP